MMGFDRESFFLFLLQKEGITKGIGDDCCIIHSQNLWKTHGANIHTNDLNSLAVGMDSFCEGVHFLRNWFSPYELAQKAFMVNYSDIIAMNATPIYATLSVALSKHWGKPEIKQFVHGISDFCRKYHITLIGGDTITSVNIQIHITLFGKTHKHTLYRDKIPVGSILCYTNDVYPQNTITQGYKMLKILLKSPKDKSFKMKGRFLLPHIRRAFIRDCAHFLKGGMDISDGILQEIKRLCVTNKLGFKPYISFFKPYKKSLLYSGESYEMLVAIAPKDFFRLKKKAARYRIQISKLGIFRRQRSILPPHKFWH